MNRIEKCQSLKEYDDEKHSNYYDKYQPSEHINPISG